MNTLATRPGLIATAWRALRVWLLREQARGIAAERREYQRAGVVGPVYLLNSINDQLRHLRAARRVELGN